MTPGMVLFAARELGEIDRADMDRMAVAGRVAQADKSGWEKFFKER